VALPSSKLTAAIRAALRRLEIDAFVLSVHDASFPAAVGEDTGRGSPHGRGAAELLTFASSLGFDGLQLGPQGRTSRANASPYDGTLFARNELSIDLPTLAREGRLTNATLARIVAARPPGERVSHVYAHDAHRAALGEAWTRFQAAGDEEAQRDLEDFRAANAAWLERDAAFDVLTDAHGTDDWTRWPGLDARLFVPARGEELACAERRRTLGVASADRVLRHAFEQQLAHAQHEALRRRASALGLRVYGDLQIGISHRDAWSLGALFLSGYRMGAPPSRTNPEGPAWGYPVLDPASPDAVAFARARMHKALGEYDGVRIDHPHGHVDPWVYADDGARDGAELLARVRAGARLFGAPDLADHPALARHAIARPDQLDRGVDRWADGWVRALDEAQVGEYARALDAVVEAARSHRRRDDDVLCEVLSTQPYPLRRAMERFGLGRFRVTQKVGLGDRSDVYRTENARAEDWVMVGSHDTRPLAQVVDEWFATGTASAHAAYLAERLEQDVSRRADYAAAAARDVPSLVQAKLAELFVGPARHVVVFFADLFGMREVYNRPGVVGPDNWTLRVPSDFSRAWRETPEAFDVPRALVTALRARGRLTHELETALTSA